MGSPERGISPCPEGQNNSPERRSAVPRFEPTREYLPETSIGNVKGGTIYNSQEGNTYGVGLETPRPPNLIEEVQKTLETTIQSSLLHIPMVRRWRFSGEKISGTAFNLLGEPFTGFSFNISEHKGAGFAGQVDRAEVGTGNFAEQSIALKTMRPTSGIRERIRDTLFLFSFQAPFLSRSDEISVRRGLIIQKLARRGAGIRFGSEQYVADPLGYYYDPKLGSFVEIHEYIDGRPTLLEPSLPGLSRELDKKGEFMGEFAKLLKEMGFSDLARQYEWWVMVSQNNVLKRHDGSLTAIDFKQGIATLIPLSPYDLGRFISDVVKLKSPVHYDYIDLARTERFISKHSVDFEDLLPYFEELKRLDRQYKEALHFSKRTRNVFVKSWEVRGLISTDAVDRVHTSKSFWLYPLLDAIPLVGEKAFKFLANRDYRRHIGSILTNKDYRERFFRVLRAQDIQGWLDAEDIAKEDVANLLNNPGSYWGFKLVGHPMSELVDKIRDNLINPLRLLFSSDYQQRWFIERIEEAEKEGTITERKTSELVSVVQNDPRAQEYLRDNLVLVGIELSSKVLTPLIGAFGTAITKEPLVFIGLTAWQFFPLPISPSGLLREAYCLGMTLTSLPRIVARKEWETLKERLVTIVGVPWKTFGNGVMPAITARTFPELSLILIKHIVRKGINFIPVFGEKGGLLEAMAFDLSYSLPLRVLRQLKI